MHTKPHPGLPEHSLLEVRKLTTAPTPNLTTKTKSTLHFYPPIHTHTSIVICIFHLYPSGNKRTAHSSRIATPATHKLMLQTSRPRRNALRPSASTYTGTPGQPSISPNTKETADPQCLSMFNAVF